MTDARLPDHLRPITIDDATITHGTLEKRGSDWVIRAKPYVVEMAKRVFRGCQSNKIDGTIKFKANPRIQEDLCWFLQRFPLDIIDKKAWDKAHTETVAHALKRIEIAKAPTKMDPSTSFSGELLDFQKEGLAFMSHNSRCLLADEMGLGKTPQAIAWAASKAAFPLLVVVMPHLQRQWASELDRFLRLDDKPPKIHNLKGLKPYALPEADVYLIHYLILRAWKTELPDFGFKAVIFDEIQELRNRQTDKYSAASKMASSVDDVIGLSGTPIYNRGGEIWNVMNILEYHCLGDYESFTREWCTYYDSDVVKDPELLGSYLRDQGLILRRRKDDVLTELPPKRRVTQIVDSDADVYEDNISRAVVAAFEMIETTNPLERGRHLRNAVNDTRRATGMAKAEYVCSFVQMLLEAGETVLLFAYHHSVFDVYADKLKAHKPVMITGRETTDQKEASKKAFMEGKTNLCMISLRAAAGLNLERANCVVFGELDWSPAVHSQAEDRAHRMGQKNDSVLCYYLTCDEGTDIEMRDVLGLKVSQFIGLMGDKVESEEDRTLAGQAVGEHMERIVERLRERFKRKRKGMTKKASSVPVEEEVPEEVAP